MRQDSAHPRPPRAASDRPRDRPPSLWGTLLDLVAARDCGGCGTAPLPRSALCGPCTLAAIGAGPARRAVLDARATPRTFAATYYEDPVRTMLIHYKERSRSDLRAVLGSALATAVAALLEDRAGGVPITTYDPGVPIVTRDPGLTAATSGSRSRPATPAPPALILVPMPSARSAVRRRGADTTAQLARTAARTLTAVGAGPVRSLPALRHTRRVADQAGLTRAERAANLSGALRVPPRRARLLAGADVVLVDDIATSGATLAEGARALRAAGARVAGAATVAAARLAR